jgi:hypothetical protein
MKLFELLFLKNKDVLPQSSKVHLAVWNGEDNPLDVYLSGEFEDWQSWQSKKNFERNHIVSLIQLSGTDRWLFVGSYNSIESKYIEEHNCFQYSTSEIDSLNELAGRLIVSFKRSGRASYLLAENWSENMFVSEVLPKKMVVEDFKGYGSTCLSKIKLDLIINQNLDSWRSALSAVSGIYLITDTATGKLYVGSATGDCGIWQRWCDYSYNGHGGNKELKRVLKNEGNDYSSNFQYSILEIADTHTNTESIIERESYWKNVLCSREYGYNSN